MKKKALIITFCYPPYPSPESYITLKFLNELSKSIDLEVLTLESFGDKNNHYIENNNIMCHRVKIPLFIKWIINLPRLPFRPDRFILTLFFFKKKLNSLDLDKFDFFFTRSQFHSSHILGLFLKNYFPQKKWLASFSDPWSKNMFQKKIPFFSKLNKRIEKKVMEKADYLIFPLNTLKDHFDKLYNINKKALIVNHSFENVKIRKKITDNFFTIRYFGKIYAERNIFPLLDSVISLIKKKEKIKFEIFVDNDFILKNKNKLEFYKKYVKIGTYVRTYEYLKLIKSSDLLIVLDGDSPDVNLFFQSKLVDYLGSENMIFHIGSADTINRKITKKCNGISCINNTKEITNSLKQIIKNKSKFKPNKVFIQQFRTKNVVKKFLNQINL